jgi:Domain of unknown function (DUF4136)
MKKHHSMLWAGTVAMSLALTAASASAQKVKFVASKTENFGGFKKYAWDKNYLLTRQTPDDQKAIGEEITSSMNRQLQAKGYVLVDKDPDFTVSYEAGGIAKVDMSTAAILDYDPGNPNAINQPAAIGPVMTVSDAWSSVLGGLRITVVDARTKKKVWMGEISKSIRDPQKFMRNLDAEVNDATAKLLKNFPPQ